MEIQISLAGLGNCLDNGDRTTDIQMVLWDYGKMILGVGAGHQSAGEPHLYRRIGVVDLCSIYED